MNSSAVFGGSDCAILCQRIVKRYQVLDQGSAWRILFSSDRNAREVNALCDVSLTVPKGEILGVLGRNGSGKSTLLRVVGGVYSPSEGHVRLEGTVGSLFELGGLGNQFVTGHDYADRVLRFQGVPSRELPRLLKEIREFAELGDYFERNLHTYSSGMAARLYFATAMAIPRDIFLIDELLSVGDMHFQAKSWRKVRERLAGGASGILVTHDWSAVVKLCHRAVILERGELIVEGLADRVVARYLDIPEPDRSIARFENLDASYSAVSGEDLQLRFEVNALRNIELEFAYSIEILMLGVGWEIMLISDFVPVGRGIGKRAVILAIPRLPIAPGSYYLNLFLRTRSDRGAAAADARTWTTGSGLEFVVTGSARNSCFRIPVKWHLESIEDA